ncbi:hypothetical protein [Dermatobacter hominis]|uniref:hypothetical protein n=1 Tax=Dermatobacter hominis TaxID=2884263 RepID=UPI001D12F29E|nr:hypothetical protein [Dermatobacter hominis]UDY34356.1 hypothetical protein LH044_13530 [Dermatobacter hominis]
MTDPTPPPHDPTDEPIGDELVTAVLDGEATDEQVAAVAADPALTARLESFRAVQAGIRAGAIADADELSPGAGDRIAAALAAAGHHVSTACDDAPEPAAPPVVRPIATARRRRLSVVGGVAAALVLVAAAVGLGLSAGSGGSDDSASGSADLTERSTAAPSAEADSGGDQGAAVTTTVAPFDAGEQRASAPTAGSAAAADDLAGLPDLGTVADASQLRAAVGDPARLVPRSPGELPCPLFPSEQWVRIGTVLLDGRQALVAVAADDGELRAAFVDTCETVG